MSGKPFPDYSPGGAVADTHGHVTLQQVAARAKVSLATASRAINGSSRRVNPELAERVLQAARELNYTANAQAQAMVRGRTTVVGLVVSDIVDPYFSSIASGVMGRAEQTGLMVTLAATQRDAEREQSQITLFSSQRAQAIVIVGSRSTDTRALDELSARIAAFEQAGGRVVNVGQPLLDCDTVVIPNRQGGREMAEALIGLGHTRFAILCGPDTLITPVDRTAGFREAVIEAGHPEPLLYPGAFTRDGGHEAMNRLLDDRPDVGCVFAVADAVAMGAIAACRERGVSIPDDLALAGFDDIPGLRDLHPPLTTYRLPMLEIGEAALGLAIEPASATRRRVEIKGEVVVRESTRRVR